MKSSFFIGSGLSLLLTFGAATASADIFDIFKPRRATATNDLSDLSGFSQDQLVSGLKQALGKGIDHAIRELGHEGGFLTNLNVRIPMPESLRTVERGLRRLRQDQMADEFVATMNHAAELAVPEAAGIFADSLRQITIDDAKSLLKGGDDAATQYFRRVGEPRLREKMLPVIQKTTAETGVTSSYKKLLERAGPATNLLGLNRDKLDLDAYVTGKAMDGLFKTIAEEEKKIRQNPAARTTELLQKVFGRASRTE